MQQVIEMINVDHSYSKGRVLKNLSLSVDAGEFVCLLGPSGCGKTTTLKIASGLETPQGGTVKLNGVEVVKDGTAIIPPEKRGLGVVFQDFALFPHLTVKENVGFGLFGLRGRDCDREVDKALESVGMLSLKNMYPSELSGGQQQRVSLARAIAPAPKLVLLDEPFSHLDSRLKESIRDQTLHVLKSVGAAGLMITHDPEEAMFMADKIIVMFDGEVLQVGTPRELYLQPKTPFIAKFLGDVNSIYGVVEGGIVKTPAGHVPVKNIKDGTKVRVLVRPEGITLKEEDCECCVTAQLEESRMLGMTSLAHINCTDENGTTWHMHARIYGHKMPDFKKNIHVCLNPEHTFIFVVE